MTHRTKRILFFLINLLPLLNGLAFAHGGGGLGGGLSKPCEVKIGPYSLHLTGYQPERDPEDSYCERFPGVGPTVLSIDFTQNALRRMKIDTRIIRAKSWDDAESGSDKSTQETVAHFPASMYPKGLLTLSHTFTDKGIYAAIIGIENIDGSVQTGRVAFSIGMPPRHIHRNLFIALLGLMGIGHLVVKMFGKSKPVPEVAKG